MIKLIIQKNMKNQKGMGHLTTTICIGIIILLILGFALIIKKEYQEEKVQNYETDMLLIQGKIKILAQEATIQKNEEILKDKKVSDNLEDGEIAKLLENNVISQDEEDFSKYYILKKDNLDEIGLNGIRQREGNYIVNYKTYEIIYSKGVKIEENVFYKLSDLQKQNEVEEVVQEEKQEENIEETEENNEDEKVEENVEEDVENRAQ